MLAQPGVEVVRTLEVEQGVEKSFERAEREGLNAGLLAGSQGAQAMPKQTEGDGSGFGLAAIQPALLSALLLALLPPLLLALLQTAIKDFVPVHGSRRTTAQMIPDRSSQSGARGDA